MNRPSDAADARITPFGRDLVLPDPFRSLSANEREVLALIRLEGPISRAEIARRSGLAMPTVSRLTGQLAGEGLIVAEEKVMMGRMGQPSLPLLLARHAAYAFGAAVRADSLAVCLTHLSGEIVATVEETHCGLTREETMVRVRAAVERIVDQTGVPRDRVCGLGLAISGFFVDDQRRINAPLGMEDWATGELERDFSHALGLPVLVENDGSAAALGESIYGQGREYPSFAYLYVDRGMGGGIILNGRLMRGVHGNAGEFTGMLPPDLRRHRPTLALLADMAGADAGQSLTDFAASLDPDGAAVGAWIERVAPATSSIISAIAAIVDPAAIVLGGRLPAPVAERLIQALNFYSVPVRGRDRAFPALVASCVQGDAASLGAGTLCFDRCFL
ncbi:ROK family transcriptional regulator [Novosphingobium sediminicola]|uniref:Putative NBD/HSP70 family sugar kinase n=1 Tax=Novosphingobium sediminicola TaxID=563162 RepID=A0A7W6CNZ2_9SPHN|nr:ROK family transcriptional regulator [Novosphingobium sediminicola]MBB3957275.1 putative NBD/HSP70 family sugar kinase [Novosphingobium sediminicola]